MILLDPVTGKPEKVQKGVLHNPGVYNVTIPEHIEEWLDKARAFPGKSGPQGSGVGWRDVLTPRRVMTESATQVLNTTTETVMLPDYTFLADSLEAGDAFKYTLAGSISTVITTPGTITLRLRWGGVAGTVLAASGAFAPDPTAAATTITYLVEWWAVCQNDGATGAIAAVGRIEWGADYDDATATTLKGNLDMRVAPVSAPAAVTVNTTTASALSPTVAFSVSTATTQLTNLIGILESLN